MTYTAGTVFRITARMKSTVYGDHVAVYHVRNDVDETDTDANIIAACVDWLNTAYANIATTTNNTLDPYDVRVDQVELVGGVERLVRNLGTVSWVMTSPPAATGDTVSPMDSAIINFRTNLPRVFGRKYMGGIGESHQANGILTGTATTALTNFATALLAGFTNTSVTYAMGVLSIKSTATNKFALLTAAVINSIMGTQRRRRQNRGS